jgi:DNA-binding FadR family transcriptional regulator
MSDLTLARLRNWISGAGLSEGARIPAERELSMTLGVTRADLRNALLVLESEGILQRHVGRGTFLARPPRTARAGGIDQTAALLAETTSPIDAMQARLALEPEMAGLAAMNASPRHLRELHRLSQDMRKAATWPAYEALDAGFHEIIAQATGSPLLGALHRIVNAVRLVVVWRRLDTPAPGPQPDYRSFAEHDAILAAIEQRDATAAAQAMRVHLQSTLSRMTATP